MLPEYDNIGNLLPGIHPAGLEEISQRFIQPAYRTRGKLTSSLEQYVKEIRALGPIGIYIDGSYVTQKLAPSDIDIAVIFPQGFDISANAFNFKNPRYKRMSLDIHLFVVGWNDELLSDYLRDWQTDLNTNLPKGIVYLEFPNDQE